MRSIFTCLIIAATSFGSAQDWEALQAKLKNPLSGNLHEVVEALNQTSDFRALPILDTVAWGSDRKLGDKALEVLEKVLRRRQSEKYRLAEGKSEADQTAIYESYQNDLPYWAFIQSGPYISLVRDALYSSGDMKVRQAMEQLAAKTYSNDDPPDVDDIQYRCGSGRDWQSDAALQLLVSKRPEVARRMILDQNSRIRSRLLGELSELRDQQDIALVRLLFASPNITLRAAAVRSAERLFYPELLPLLIQASRDKSVIVRFASVRGLIKFVSDESIDALSRLLADPHELIGLEALSALVTLNSTKFDRVILQLLASKDELLQERALLALAVHPVPEAVGTLFELVGKDRPLRSKAITALAAAKDEAATAKVIAIAVDRKDKDRSTAFLELAKLGTKGQEALVSLLSDASEDPEILSSLCDLARWDNLQFTIGALQRLRMHPAEGVRSAATEALKAMNVPIIDP